MKLVVIPGTGCPDNKKYASVYRLLERKAPSYGYSSADISLRWPGHNFNGTLTLKGAVKVAWGKVEKLEAGTEDYDLLARSFGCYVALMIAKEKQPQRLRKIILWGPPPYWLVWEMFYRDIKENSRVAKDKGTSVSDTLFPTIVPLESMLSEIRCETIVATGERDPYVPQAYLRYLESIVQKRSDNPRSIRFKDAIPGAVHEVTEDAPKTVIDAYLKAVFE